MPKSNAFSTFILFCRIFCFTFRSKSLNFYMSLQGNYYIFIQRYGYSTYTEHATGISLQENYCLCKASARVVDFFSKLMMYKLFHVLTVNCMTPLNNKLFQESLKNYLLLNVFTLSNHHNLTLPAPTQEDRFKGRTHVLVIILYRRRQVRANRANLGLFQIEKYLENSFKTIDHCFVIAET